jgi:predicted MFS family arabinose efflux permease
VAAPAAQDAAARPSPLGRWQVWRIVLGIGSLCVAQLAVLSFIAVFLHDVARFSLAATSAAMVVYQLGAAVLRVWSGAWTDRNANRPAFLRRCSLVTSAIFAALAIMARVSTADPVPVQAWSLLVLLVLGGMVASCWHGVAFTELAVRAGPAHVGTALGMGNTLAFGSYFLTPLMIPVALAAGGWPAAWWLVAACALGALPMFPRQVP